MKLKFKINLKESKIPEWIKVPKTLIEGKLWKSKLPNFVEKNTLKKPLILNMIKKIKS